jgi:hypothetical protein
MNAPRNTQVVRLGLSRFTPSAALNVIGLQNITWHPPHFQKPVT